jgi:hypothetical protein
MAFRKIKDSMDAAIVRTFVVVSVGENRHRFIPVINTPLCSRKRTDGSEDFPVYGVRSRQGKHAMCAINNIGMTGFGDQARPGGAGDTSQKGQECQGYSEFNQSKTSGFH